MTMTKCDDAALNALLDADEEQFRSGGELAEVTRHVESCMHCQVRISELAAEDRKWDEVQQVLSPASQSMDRNDESLDARERWRRPTAWSDAMAKSLLSPPSHPEMLGRIGRYDVERLIGSGGMGVVFKAYDTELNRPVAVKLLAPYLAENGSARKRFAREARAAAAVVDEHVVAIHNVESDDDPRQPPFLVMKYIAGGSLQQRIDRDGPLNVCEILRIGMQTAKGLAAAHAQGLIHRDVKPSNILLDEGVERALLTDFGLAHAEDDACLTRSGFHPGTPHYMSPEQVRGEAIDGRSDLFSLGCVLYAICTGHPPFRAETSYAVLRRITDDTARPIRELNPDIPQWLDQIVMKLLSKSRVDRFDSASEVAKLLENSLAHVQDPTTTPLPKSAAALSLPRSGRPSWPKLITAAAFALSLVFAGVLIVLEMNKGTLHIESNSEVNVPIRIIQGEKIVDELTVTQEGSTTRLHAGRYRIEVDGEGTGIDISGDRVILKRGDTWLAKIVVQSKPAKAIPKSSVETYQKLEPSKGFRQQRGGPFDSRMGGYFAPGDPLSRGAYIPGVPEHAGGTNVISEIVAHFNRNMNAVDGDNPQPPLTVDELLCCCRWKLQNGELSAELKDLLTNVGIGRWLPEQWAIEGGHCQIATMSDGLISVYMIQIVNRYSGTQVLVRKRYLSPSVDVLVAESPQVDPTVTPLYASITEFNAMHHQVAGKRQPPLTFVEVNAAILEWNTRRSEAPVDNDTFAMFQRIAKTRELPADAKLEVLSSFGSQEGDIFNIWSVRIVMPQVVKPEWSYAFEIRKQYISVDSVGDSLVHWGKPNDDGLQAGFRLLPSQRIYQVGQPIKTEFFYRSILGKPIDASLPNIFSHLKLIAHDSEGTVFDVVEVRERTIGGARTAKIGDKPIRMRGQPLSLSYITPIPRWDITKGSRAETWLTVADGQKCFLTYIVSDLDGGELQTGEVDFDIAPHNTADTLPNFKDPKPPIPTPRPLNEAVSPSVDVNEKE